MKALIFGATGQVGSYCKTLFEKEGYEVIAPSRDWAPRSLGVEISGNDEVCECIDRHKPDVVINAAAYNDVDGAEESIGRAFLSNAVGPMNIALALQGERRKCKFITFSSEYVFDGYAKHPYKTNAPTNPLSVYGTSKLLGEQAVASILRNQKLVDHYIIRTSWVFSSMKTNSNFVWRALNLLRERDKLAFVDDQDIRPTFAGDLAKVCLQFVNPPVCSILSGVYHATGSSTFTPWSWVQTIAQRYGINKTIDQIALADYKAKAKRPSWCVLDNYELQEHWLNPPGNPVDALNLPEFDALKEIT